MSNVPVQNMAIPARGYDRARRSAGWARVHPGNVGRPSPDSPNLDRQRSKETRIMAKIDKVIDAHGGWPDAFAPAGESEEES